MIYRFCYDVVKKSSILERKLKYFNEPSSKRRWTNLYLYNAVWEECEYLLRIRFLLLIKHKVITLVTMAVQFVPCVHSLLCERSRSLHLHCQWATAHCCQVSPRLCCQYEKKFFKIQKKFSIVSFVRLKGFGKEIFSNQTKFKTPKIYLLSKLPLKKVKIVRKYFPVPFCHFWSKFGALGPYGPQFSLAK